MKIETSDSIQSTLIDDDALVGELDALGVHFLSDGDGRLHPQLVADDLLVGLAASSDARVQSAIVPLLLARPDYACGALPTRCRLHWRAQVIFCCYYTAAYYLQRKYAAALRAAQLPTEPLPNLFIESLALPAFATPEEGLCNLALRQRQLLGDAINWFGAYEHALQHLLRRRRTR